MSGWNVRVTWVPNPSAAPSATVVVPSGSEVVMEKAIVGGEVGHGADDEQCAEWIIDHGWRYVHRSRHDLDSGVNLPDRRSDCVNAARGDDDNDAQQCYHSHDRSHGSTLLLLSVRV